MLQTVLAYLLTLFISPIVGGLSQFISVPLLTPLARYGIHKLIITLLTGIFTGVAAVWGGTLIFMWLGVEPGILMLSFLFIHFFINDIKRYKTKEDKSIELGYLLGDIVGIIFGGIFFMYS